MWGGRPLELTPYLYPTLRFRGYCHLYRVRNLKQECQQKVVSAPCTLVRHSGWLKEEQGVMVCNNEGAAYRNPIFYTVRLNERALADLAERLWRVCQAFVTPVTCSKEARIHFHRVDLDIPDTSRSALAALAIKTVRVSIVRMKLLRSTHSLQKMMYNLLLNN